MKEQFVYFTYFCLLMCGVVCYSYPMFDKLDLSITFGAEPVYRITPAFSLVLNIFVLWLMVYVTHIVLTAFFELKALESEIPDEKS